MTDRSEAIALAVGLGILALFLWALFHTAARRPKPPSLKEQALAELELLRGDAYNHGLGFDAPAIRRALESLPS